MSVLKRKQNDGTWIPVVDRAENIALTNPEMLDNNESAISVAEGFTKLNERITKLQRNIEFIYKEGTLGGNNGSSSGSGSGTSSVVTDVITLTSDNKIITYNGNPSIYIKESETAEISFYIKSTSSTSTKYNVTVTAGGTVLSDWNSVAVYSSKNGSRISKISVSNVSSVTAVVISASDDNGNELESYTVFIRPSTYNLTVTGHSNNETYGIYPNQITNKLIFNITNNVPGSTSTLKFKVDNIYTISRTNAYDANTSIKMESITIEDILGSTTASAITGGEEFSIVAELYISSISEETPVISFNLKLAINNLTNATITVNGNTIYSASTDFSDNTIETSSSNEQTSSDGIPVTIKISAPSTFTTFLLAYKVYYNLNRYSRDLVESMLNPENPSEGYVADIDEETLFSYQGQVIEGVTEDYTDETTGITTQVPVTYTMEKSTFGVWSDAVADISEAKKQNDRLNNGSSMSRSFTPTDFQEGYFYIKVKCWDINGNGGGSFRIVKGYAKEASDIFVFDYNKVSSMAIQFNAWTALNSSNKLISTATEWNSNKSDAGDTLSTILDDADIEAGRTMYIYNTNGETSGFLDVNNDLSGNAPCLRFAGNAYGLIKFAPFATHTEINQTVSKFQDSSWTLSITFKTDKHPDSERTIMDIGDWSTVVDTETNESTIELSQGLHIGIDEVYFKLGNAGNDSSMSAKLVQNVLTTIDIVYSIDETEKTALLKLYVNGVMTSARYFNSYKDAQIFSNSYIWLGQRVTSSVANSNITADRNCDFNLYDFKFYTSALNDYAIVRNFINAQARVKLAISTDSNTGVKTGSYDWDFINEMREKNYFIAESSSELKCSILTENISTSNDIFNTNDVQTKDLNMYEYITNSTIKPIPVLLITLNQDGDADDKSFSTDFFNTYRQLYKEDNLAEPQSYKFSCSLTFTPAGGVNSSYNRPITISRDDGSTPYITLQGTSTMSYSAKNLEIYYGSLSNNQDRLFTPKAGSWIPENRHTLKADVVDSSHCNNAAMGKFINESGVFDANPAQTNSKNIYKNLVKHTLEGFPCYVFIQYYSGDEGAKSYFSDYESRTGVKATETIQVPQFMGIYSFNLGRGAYYNTGFKVLSSYTLNIDDPNYSTGPYLASDDNKTPINIPAKALSYTALSDEEAYGNTNGCVSYECTTTDNQWGSFQQDDESIIRKYYELKYPEQETDNAFKSFQYLFTVFANSFTNDIPEGYEEQPYEYYSPLVNEQYVTPIRKSGNPVYNSTGLFTFETIRHQLDWKTANAYYLIALAFGLVDSLGKNSTYRCWDITDDYTSYPSDTTGKWYMCYYDMDTGLGLTNSGDETVASTAYTRNFNNLVNTISYVSEPQKFKITDSIANTYSCWNSRMWNVITTTLLNKDGNIEGSTNYGSFRDMWAKWRTTSSILASADNFIENYYKEHIKNIGELLYNIDYKIKYLDPCFREDITNSDSSTISYNDARSISFLHGRRTEYVTNWLKERLIFLDSVIFYQKYDQYATYFKTNLNNYPLYNTVALNTATNTAANTIELTITASSPCLFSYSQSNTTATALLLNKDTPQTVICPVANGVTAVSFNMLNLISKIEGFSSLKWTKLENFKCPNLTEFDISGMNSLGSATNLGGTSNIFASMTELRTLNMAGTTISGVANPTSGFSVDLTYCTKLVSVDVSDSHVSNIILPSGGCLQYLNVNGSIISSMTIQNQSALTTSGLKINNCKKLTKLTVSNCSNLTSLTLTGSNIEELIISDCTNLRSLNVSASENLQKLTISNCEGLKELNFASAGTKCTNNLVYDLTGAPNLETINASGTSLSTLKVSPEIRNTLSSLNIDNSKIAQFEFTDEEPSTYVYNDKFGNYIETYKVLDFNGFKNITESRNKIVFGTNPYIEAIRFNNIKDQYFIVGSSGSNSLFGNLTNLHRVFGAIAINNDNSGFANTFSGLTKFTLNTKDTYEKYNCILPDSSGYYQLGETEEEKSVIDSYRSLWFEGDDVTNLKIMSGTTNISGFFNMGYNSTDNNTISIYDVYYLLSQCDNVQFASKVFYGCVGIETTDEHPLARKTFKYLSNVSNIDSMFEKCSKMSGPIFSPRAAFDTEHAMDENYYDGLYSSLKVLKNGINLFASTGMSYVDTFVFWKTSPDWTAESSLLGYTDASSGTVSGLKGMFGGASVASVYQAGVDNAYYPIKSSVLFKYCPNIRSLSGIFTSLSSKFTLEIEHAIDSTSVDGKEIDVTLLFHGLPKLEIISGTFSESNITLLGEINNTVFGGGNLETLDKAVSTPAVCTITDYEGEERQCVFPRGITDFSEVFNTSFGSESTAFIDWNGFNLLFKNQNKSSITTVASLFKGLKLGIDKDGIANTPDAFPYKIFAGMASLEDVSYFFYDHGILSKNSANTLVLPGAELFADTVNLKNISYLFACSTQPVQDEGTRYIELQANCFANCSKLEIVVNTFENAGVFSKSVESTINRENYFGIPYGLFFHGYTEKTISCEPENEAYDEEGNLLTSFVRKTLNRSITKFTNVFKGCNYICNNQVQYIAETAISGTHKENQNDNELMFSANGHCGNITETNYDYDPRKFISKNFASYTVNSSGVIIQNVKPNTLWIANPDYSPKKIIWNPYGWDGIYRKNIENLRDNFKWMSPKTETVQDEIGNTSVNRLDDIEIDPLTIEPYSFINCDADKAFAGIFIDSTMDKSSIQSTLDDFHNDGRGTSYAWCFSNYILPADILRYCAEDCYVENALSNINAKVLPTKPNTQTGNLRGRIPPVLFRNLTGVKSLNSVLSNNYYAITPWSPSAAKYEFSVDDEGVSTVTRKIVIPGSMFAPETFANNTNLETVSSMYTFMNIPRDVMLVEQPEIEGTSYTNDLYANNNYIINASNAFSKCFWGNGSNLNDSTICYLYKRNIHTVTIEETVEKDTEYTIPVSYTVGSKNLQIYNDGKLINAGSDYVEIGSSGEKSTIIKFTETVEAGTVFKFTIVDETPFDQIGNIFNSATALNNINSVFTYPTNTNELHAKVDENSFFENGCGCITYINDSMFINNTQLNDVSSAFAHNSLGSGGQKVTLPEFWNAIRYPKISSSSHSGVFNGTDFSNVKNTVPSSWRN